LWQQNSNDNCAAGGPVPGWEHHQAFSSGAGKSILSLITKRFFSLLANISQLGDKSAGLLVWLKELALDVFNIILFLWQYFHEKVAWEGFKGITVFHQHGLGTVNEQPWSQYTDCKQHNWQLTNSMIGMIWEVFAVDLELPERYLELMGIMLWSDN